MTTFQLSKELFVSSQLVQHSDTVTKSLEFCQHQWEPIVFSVAASHAGLSCPSFWKSTKYFSKMDQSNQQFQELELFHVPKLNLFIICAINFICNTIFWLIFWYSFISTRWNVAQRFIFDRNGHFYPIFDEKWQISIIKWRLLNQNDQFLIKIDQFWIEMTNFSQKWPISFKNDTFSSKLVIFISWIGHLWSKLVIFWFLLAIFIKNWSFFIEIGHFYPKLVIFRSNEVMIGRIRGFWSENIKLWSHEGVINVSKGSRGNAHRICSTKGSLPGTGRPILIRIQKKNCEGLW